MGTAIQLLGGTLRTYLASAVVALTDGATIATNASQGNVFAVTIAGDRTISNPTNPVDGQVIRYRITQGTGGNFTLSFGNAFDFGAAGAPTLSTSAGKVDILGFEYIAALTSWCYLGSALGN